VLTLEDPIEYQLPGVSQTQVSTKKGMTFASGLRSVLRQDPDVIMVGEIRDRETAVMAVQSALTGHLVFSTVHTNDAASTITRLLDLGIEPYLVASSVVGVLAQRLVRRICKQCGRNYPPTDSELGLLGLQAHQVDAEGFCRGEGCDQCRHTGYLGRVGLFELLVINDAIRQQIQDRATAAAITRTAAAGGMTTLRTSGVNRVRGRVTTVEEVERVTMRAADWAE
jgi:general secretion pathway protein E